MEEEFVREIQNASDEYDRHIRHNEGEKHLRSELHRLEERRCKALIDQKIRPIFVEFKNYLEEKGHTCDIIDDKNGIDLDLHLADLLNQGEHTFPQFSVYGDSTNFYLYATLHASRDYAGEITIVKTSVIPSAITGTMLKKYITKLIVAAYKDAEGFEN